jgi:hypothetical protein
MKNRLVMVATPIVGAVSRGISRAMTMLQPVFDWVGRAMAQVGDLVEAVVESLAEGVEILVGWFEELVGQVAEFAGPWPSIQEVIVGVFRAVGTAGGYAFDAIRVAIAPVVYNIGVVIEGISQLATEFHETIRKILQTVADLPVWLAGTAPILAKKALDNLGAIEEGGKRLGREFQKLGMDWWNNIKIGETAQKFNNWLDAVLRKPKQLAKEMIATGKAADAVLKKFDNAALLKGSSAEVSARLTAEFGGKLKQEQQLAEQKRANGFLQKIDGTLKGIAGSMGDLFHQPLLPM